MLGPAHLFIPLGTLYPLGESPLGPLLPTFPSFLPSLPFLSFPFGTIITRFPFLPFLPIISLLGSVCLTLARVVGGVVSVKSAVAIVAPIRAVEEAFDGSDPIEVILGFEQVQDTILAHFLGSSK